jgi:hypothetical protein
MNPQIQDAGFIFIAEAEDLYHKRNQLMPVRHATLFRNHVVSAPSKSTWFEPLISNLVRRIWETVLADFNLHIPSNALLFFLQAALASTPAPGARKRLQLTLCPSEN